MSRSSLRRDSLSVALSSRSPTRAPQLTQTAMVNSIAAMVQLVSVLGRTATIRLPRHVTSGGITLLLAASSAQRVSDMNKLLEQVRRDTLWLGLILLIGTIALSLWWLGGGPSHVC